jgi:hypothetical protein
LENFAKLSNQKTENNNNNIVVVILVKKSNSCWDGGLCSISSWKMWQWGCG